MTRYQQQPALRSLVVEDHLVSRRYITEALRRCGWAVKHCRNAEQALSLFSEWNPQLVISDLRMPGADGLELAQALVQRSADRNHEITLLLVTAQTSPALERRARAAGFARVLRKPVKFTELTKILSELKESRFPAPGCAGRRLRSTAYHQGTPPRVNDNRQLAELETEPSPLGEAALQSLFRAELRQRLPQLENLLLVGRLAGAKSVIHQLTASAAICENRQLETLLREFDAACSRPVDAPRLAGAFTRFHRCARSVLQ